MSAPEPFKHLLPGRLYRVSRPFQDWFGKTWEVDERLSFVTHSVVPYHSGVTLTFKGEDGVERVLTMQWLPEEQGAVLDALEAHLVETEISPR